MIYLLALPSLITAWVTYTLIGRWTGDIFSAVIASLVFSGFVGQLTLLGVAIWTL